MFASNDSSAVIRFTPGSLVNLYSAESFSSALLMTIDLSGMNLSKCAFFSMKGRLITTDYVTFYGSDNDISSVRPVGTLKVKYLHNVSNFTFRSNTSLTKGDFIFEETQTMGSTFYSCSNLTDLSLQGETKFSESSKYAGAFYNTTGLANLQITFIDGNVYFDSSKKLTQESVNNIMNALQTVTNKTITLASTQYAYLTEDQIAEATAKGWTINQA